MVQFVRGNNLPRVKISNQSSILRMIYHCGPIKRAEIAERLGLTLPTITTNINSMIADGIGEYANPSSISRAAVMMLRHIGYSEKAAQLEAALDKAQKALDLPGDGTGNTASDFTDFVTENL